MDGTPPESSAKIAAQRDTHTTGLEGGVLESTGKKD
jgi:hypothetical protein